MDVSSPLFDYRSRDLVQEAHRKPVPCIAEPLLVLLRTANVRATAYNVAFLVENNLGHRTHLRSLKRHISSECGINPYWLPVEPYLPDVWSRLPIVRDRTPLSWSGRAATQIRELRRSGKPIDLIYLHTVNIALAARFTSGSIPQVISLDGTPEPSKTFATYRHEAQPRGAALAAREYLYRSALQSAKALVAFSPWVEDSLINHYAIEPSKVRVFTSGIDLETWGSVDRRSAATRRPRVLFVGGDFHRKGGDRLLDVWWTRLRSHCDLDIVSRSAPPGLTSEAGVRVFHELASDSPELRQVFAEASVFALPTRGDAMPFVVMEAMASSLPVVASRIGGIPSMVEEGTTGYLIDDTDDVTLGDRLLALVTNPSLVEDMGAAARLAAVRQFDAAANYSALGRHLASLAQRCCWVPDTQR